MEEYCYTERHMGTDVTLSFIMDTKDIADALAGKVFAQIAKYEAIFSRFQDSSELSQLNHSGSQKVSEAFFDVLTKSIALTKQTDGAFNPLMQVARLGYIADFPALSGVFAPEKTPYNTEIDAVQIDPATRTVTLAPGQQLDFGGVLKGYLAHTLGARITQDHPECSGSIINLGGDLYTYGYDTSQNPFIFYIYNPVTDTEIPIPLSNTCMATSGTYARKWNTEDGSMHHIVDSKTTRNSASEIVSATVIHPDGAVAEAYTKVFLTRAHEEAHRLAEEIHCSYVLITHTGEVITHTS
jgi:FAD:protein FMN transferase